MGVFEAMRTVVLEAGRLDRRDGRRPAADSPVRRFGLFRMPVLPVLLLSVLVV